MHPNPKTQTTVFTTAVKDIFSPPLLPTTSREQNHVRMRQLSCKSLQLLNLVYPASRPPPLHPVRPPLSRADKAYVKEYETAQKRAQKAELELTAGAAHSIGKIQPSRRACWVPSWQGKVGSRRGAGRSSACTNAGCNTGTF